MADRLSRAGFLAADLHRLGSLSCPGLEPAPDRTPIDVEVRTSGEGTLRLSYTPTGTRERVDGRVALPITRYPRRDAVGYSVT